jgi:hypothetical protein
MVASSLPCYATLAGIVHYMIMALSQHHAHIIIGGAIMPL